MDIFPILITKEKSIYKFKYEKQYWDWIASKHRSEVTMKIRKNLYELIDPSTNDIYSTKFEIASNISKSYFICLHSALEYYGLANQVYSDKTVGSFTKFNNFIFKDIEYIYKHSKTSAFVKDVVSEGIRVTILQKIIVDCIDEIDHASGIKEVLNALEQVKYLNEGKLLDVLEKHRKMFLFQKACYLLEIYNEQLKLSDDFFNKCESHLTNKTNYFF